jgi:hypothetical protein
MNRRAFVQLAGAAAAAFVLDPERVLWRPGARTHFLAPPGGWRDAITIRKTLLVTMTLPPLPKGWRLERAEDPAFERQRDALMAQLNQNTHDLMRLMVRREGWPQEINFFQAQREALRQELMLAYDLRPICFIAVGPEDTV